MVVSDSPHEVRDLIIEAMVEGGWAETREEAAREVTRRVYRPE
jgi:hypothetical protein